MIVPENDNLKWLVRRHIADNVRCVTCHRSFAPGEIRILDRQENVWFVSVSCDVCGSESLILVTVETRSSDTTALSTRDRQAKEIISKSSPDTDVRASPDPITVQEIEELGRFLHSYRGNLSEFWDTDV